MKKIKTLEQAEREIRQLSFTLDVVTQVLMKRIGMTDEQFKESCLAVMGKIKETSKTPESKL